MPGLQMVFDVLAIDGASGVFKRIGDSAGEAGAKVDAATTQVNNAGKKLEQGFALAGAAVAVVSVKMAADFQTSVTKLATTAGESTKNLKMVGDGMLTMAGQVGISANDLAKGMYIVESSGLHGADALTALKAAAQGAKQEQADLGKTTDALTTILHDYNIPASQSADVMSKLVTAVSAGKTTLEDFTGSLHSVTPLAAALHVPLQDILGDLAAMTASGESADQATQNMADALRHLQKPTQPMIDELAQLGITASDLGAQLGTKGLAGTIQEISQAILQHMGPAGTVLLGTFNDSKVAAADAKQIFDNLPASVQKVAQGYIDGTLSLKDWRTELKGMPADQAALAGQWKTMEDRAQGFNQALKSGKPDAQQYSAALQAAMGDSAGLTVALQLTGEHTDVVNKSIQNIAKSTGDASGNIKGWGEVQGNFNQQLSEAGAKAGTMAIQLGQNLLPALTSTLGYVNRDVLPGIEHLGGAAGDAAHWFSQLPGPVKDFAFALGALRVADMIGVFDKLSASAGGLRKAFSGFGAEVSGLQMWSQWQAAAGKAEAPMSKFSAALQVAGGRLSGLRGAASSLMGAFGGPFGLAIAGATLGITALMSAIASHDAEVKKATDDVQKWNEAIALGGGGTSAIAAQKNLDTIKQKIADVTAKINEYNAAAAGGNARGGIGSLIAQQKELQSELDKGKQAWQDQLAGMTPLQTAQERLTLAQQDMAKAYKDNPANSPAVTVAQENLAAAQADVAGETERANRAQQTQIQQMQDAANKTMGLVDAKRQAQEASLALTQQVTDYNKQVADGTLKGDALKQATLGIVDSAEQAAKAAGDAAAKQAAQNGATDTGAASQAAFMKSLQDFDSTLTGPAKKAMDDYIAQLGGQQSQAQLTAGTITTLGNTVTGLPDSHLITINVPTDAQMQKLHDLGYATVNLPNGQVVVSADTNPALTEIQDLLSYARQQSINYRANLAITNPLPGTSQRMGTYAAGGWTGPGGKYTPVGVVHADEFVFTKEQTAKAGGPDAMYALAAAIERGYASGGWVNVPPGGWYAGSASVPVNLDPGTYKADLQKYLAQSAPGAPANVSANAALAAQMAARFYGWTGAEWNALYAVGQRESGWNNNAQNPTSTAYGIPQFLDSTWATVGLSKTSDPATQIAGMLKYIQQRYRDPIGAWAHEMSAGWYQNGTNYVPSDQLAFLHKGEAVVPASANQGAPWQGGPVEITGTLEIGGDGLARIVDGRIVQHGRRSALAAAAGSSNAMR